MEEMNKLLAKRWVPRPPPPTQPLVRDPLLLGLKALCLPGLRARCHLGSAKPGMLIELPSSGGQPAASSPEESPPVSVPVLPQVSVTALTDAPSACQPRPRWTEIWR